MAMVKCSECNAQISSNAKNCPQCGAPIKRKHTRLQWIFLGVATFGIIYAIQAGQNATDEKAAVAAAAEARKTPEQRAAEQAAKIRREAGFQRAVTGAQALKNGSKNPASFKISGAFLAEGGAMCFNYSGTNSFNATVPGYAVELKGKLRSGDPDLWNKHCAEKSIESYGSAGLGT